MGKNYVCRKTQKYFFFAISGVLEDFFCLLQKKLESAWPKTKKIGLNEI